MSADEDQSQRSTMIQNDMVSMGDNSSITFHAGSGTDTSTDRYMGLGTTHSYGFEVIAVSKAISINKINGRSLKAGITVGTTYGYNSNHMKIESITITASSATVVEVTFKGGS